MKCPHCGKEVILKSNTRLAKPKANAVGKANPKPKAKKKPKAKATPEKPKKASNS